MTELNLIPPEMIAREITQLSFTIKGSVVVTMANGATAVFKAPIDVVLSNDDQSKLWVADRYDVLLTVLL